MTGNEIDARGAVSNQTDAKRNQATVAVIIPTKDRPDFLEEAINSALNQSHAPTEIIVVDDGSAVPVDDARLRERHGPLVRVIRNEPSRGLAYSRNRGVEEATSEYVIHLDDDDLLATDAIQECLSMLCDFPEVELAFFAAEGFGPNAEHFNRVQPEGIKRVINMAKGREVRPNIVSFGRDLFPALLQAVPIAFQRVMVRKALWKTVSELRWRVYRLDPAIPDDDTAKLRITGPLRDSEWARYASLVCQQTIFLDRPLYLQRCAGQGYSSLPANRQLHMRQALEMIKYLAKGAENIPELTQWKSQIRDAFAQTCFDIAYHHYQSGDRATAWVFLKEAMSTRAKAKHLRLALRMCLPRRVPIKLGKEDSGHA